MDLSKLTKRLHFTNGDDFVSNDLKKCKVCLLFASFITFSIFCAHVLFFIHFFLHFVYISCVCRLIMVAILLKCF